MSRWKPDPSFYPSPKMAMEAPPEKLAYVAGLNYGRNDDPDAVLVVDLDPDSPTHGQVIHKLDMPHKHNGRLLGGPQMVEISRDGRRVYLTNSLYSTWDDQFYPDGLEGWMVRIDADADGGMSLDPDFFIQTGELRLHQVRLEGGDASTDSFCYP